MKKYILFGLLSVVGLITWQCTQQCNQGAVCGDYNTYSGPSNGTPTPTITPTPTPSGLPIDKGCVLVSSIASACGKTEGKLGDIVANIASTLPNILYTEISYVATLSQAIKDKGYCVMSGYPLASDELSIKITNDFSETYDVWNAKNTPQVLYQQTCIPARF